MTAIAPARGTTPGGKHKAKIEETMPCMPFFGHPRFATREAVGIIVYEAMTPRRDSTAMHSSIPCKTNVVPRQRFLPSRSGCSPAGVLLGPAAPPTRARTREEECGADRLCSRAEQALGHGRAGGVGHLTGWVGSGRVGSGRVGSGRVGSGRVGSGEKVFKSHRSGSGHPDPIRRARTDPTRETPCCIPHSTI